MPEIEKERTWQDSFDERHQFDVYPEHFMTGLRNEFAAGWHAARSFPSPAYAPVAPAAAAPSDTCACGYSLETSCNVLDPTCKRNASQPDERAAFGWPWGPKEPTTKILRNMAYALKLVPDGEIVCVQFLDVLRKQYKAAVAAACAEVIAPSSDTDAADPHGEYQGPNLTFDRLNRMRDFTASQSEKGAKTVRINAETLLCLIDTIQHHEYVPRETTTEEARATAPQAQPDERAAFEGQLLALAREFANKYSGASNANQLQAEIDFCKALREFNPRATAPQATVKGDERAPTFDAKHVSLKQRGAKLILTLELDGVESAPRYTVTPVNPAVVRAAVPQAGAPNDAAITACALMIKGICMTLPQDQWSRKIEERIRFMLATPQG